MHNIRHTSFFNNEKCTLVTVSMTVYLCDTRVTFQLPVLNLWLEVEPQQTFPMAEGLEPFQGSLWLRFLTPKSRYCFFPLFTKF